MGQIEAMSYNQNMLMMRMQQMQLAMAMQQQRPIPSSSGGSNMTIPQQQFAMNKNVMQSNMMASAIPDMNMIQPIGNSGKDFSVLESAKKMEQQKSFDFIKDTMKDAK